MEHRDYLRFAEEAASHSHRMRRRQLSTACREKRCSWARRSACSHSQRLPLCSPRSWTSHEIGELHEHKCPGCGRQSDRPDGFDGSVNRFPTPPCHKTVVVLKFE